MTVKHFLIVDDDERFALLVAKRLDPHGKCIISHSGEDALLQFEHHLREKAPFEAVFMDINMPGMDGHTVVESLRKVEAANNVSALDTFKLVMLTCHSDVSNVSKAFFRGSADAYVPKEDFSSKFLDELKSISLI